MNNKEKVYSPSHDSSLGLIYRLNNHWQEVDIAAIDGDYDRWNNILEVIHRNLIYRNPMEISEDGKTIKLSANDKQGWKILCKNVLISKRNQLNNKKIKPQAGRKCQDRRYYWLDLKDVFMRKLMFSQKLYLKETARTPGQSTFGSLGK